MKQRRNLIKLLFDRKRIELNSPHHNQLAYLFLSLILCTSILVSYLTTVRVGLDYFTLTIIGLIGLATLTSVRISMNRLRSISIKGDMIIFKSLRGKNEVTNIQSVRSVTTYHFLNIRITFVHYRLDGATQRVISITNARNFISSPENTFRKALEISERIKERANHKPGSVLQPKSERLSFI